MLLSLFKHFGAIVNQSVSSCCSAGMSRYMSTWLTWRGINANGPFGGILCIRFVTWAHSTITIFACTCFNGTYLQYNKQFSILVQLGYVRFFWVMICSWLTIKMSSFFAQIHRTTAFCIYFCTAKVSDVIEANMANHLKGSDVTAAWEVRHCGGVGGGHPKQLHKRTLWHQVNQVFVVFERQPEDVHLQKYNM